MSTPNPGPANASKVNFTGDLYRQLSDLMEGELTASEAVAALKDDAEFAAHAGLLHEIAQDLETNPALAQAMQRHASTFSPEEVAVVAAAEGENTLPGALAMLADDHVLRPGARLLSVVHGWPLFLLGFLFLITSLLVIFVIPAFKQVFSSFGADLPAPTLVLICISEFLVSYWWLVLLLVIALIFGLPWLARRKAGVASAMDSALLKIPGVRSVLTKLLVARLSALLAGAAACRISNSLVIAYLRSTLGSGQLRDGVAALESDIGQGTPLSQAARKHAWLPQKFARLAEIGERTSKVAPALGRAARTFYDEAEQAAAVFRQKLLVVTYIFTGIMVGAMVIAMYLPIFKLGSAI